jgi:hypothetical protein
VKVGQRGPDRLHGGKGGRQIGQHHILSAQPLFGEFVDERNVVRQKLSYRGQIKVTALDSGC